MNGKSLAIAEKELRAAESDALMLKMIENSKASAVVDFYTSGLNSVRATRRNLDKKRAGFVSQPPLVTDCESDSSGQIEIQIENERKVLLEKEPKDTQPESLPKKKAKAAKKAGAACAAATEADFSNFANPELALSIWATWVDYKRQQKNFTYKSDVAQAAAITKLFNCSGGSIQKARAVIEDSMANGYSGFFPYKDEMAASVRPDQIAIPIPEDTFHLEPEILERYTSTTRWFYTKCPACTGIRWLSKKEFLSVMQRSQDLIAEMWYTKCPEEDFNGHVTRSITALNASPRWEKEKWPSIFEWLRHDLSIRIFGKKDNQ